jgi:hypothetical protein
VNDIYRSQFRLPAELADRLRVAADEAGRSLNAEIVVRLQDSFAAPPGDEPASGDALERVEHEVQRLREVITAHFELVAPAAVANLEEHEARMKREAGEQPQPDTPAEK